MVKLDVGAAGPEQLEEMVAEDTDAVTPTEEANAARMVPAMFDALVMNHDGVISREEFANAQVFAVNMGAAVSTAAAAMAPQSLAAAAAREDRQRTADRSPQRVEFEERAESSAGSTESSATSRSERSPLPRATTSTSSKEIPVKDNPGRRLSFTQKIANALHMGSSPTDEEDSEQEENPFIAAARGQRDNKRQSCVFADVEAMKNKVRQNLMKTPYDVSKYYKKDGLWRKLATSNLFGNVTLAIIGLNALWIGIDTDHNNAEVLLEANPIFQIAEHSFCVFFSFEWTIRFMAFRNKFNGLRDVSFCFDTALVFMMVTETWIMTIVMVASGRSGGSGLGNASILRMARLARLSRMARMARLLRAMPELMILIKGIVAATRSVCFTLCLLCLLLYIFSIAFTQLAANSAAGDAYFGTVLRSMYSLLMQGTLMDGIGEPLALLVSESLFMAGLFLLFVLLATVTVMNMLIGVLCEVVSTVAAVEREHLTVSYVRMKLQKVLCIIDKDGNDTISQEEFVRVMESTEALIALHEVGVDVEGLVEFSDFIFNDVDKGDKRSSNGQRELSFAEFMTLVLQFRGSNGATVKDVIEVHKFMKQRLQQVSDDLAELKALMKALLSVDGGNGVRKTPSSNRGLMPPDVSLQRNRSPRPREGAQRLQIS